MPYSLTGARSAKSGARRRPPPPVEGAVPVALPAPEGVTQYIPALRLQDGTVRPVSDADSELAFDLARANVLLVVPEAWGGVQPGSRVQCLPLDDVPQMGA